MAAPGDGCFDSSWWAHHDEETPEVGPACRETCLGCIMTASADRSATRRDAGRVLRTSCRPEDVDIGVLLLYLLSDSPESCF